MPLTNSYVLAVNRLPQLFAKIRDGQAPDQVTHQLMKDWGFSSSNDRAFLPLLKALGFLTPTGQPTERYHRYRDHSQSKSVLGEALREAYNDLFLITDSPKDSDKEAIEGKFKSFHNASDNVAKNMASTFFALLKLADINQKTRKPEDAKTEETAEIGPKVMMPARPSRSTEFHYNIQVHLPATKDIEIYNSIFRSLREHFIDS